MPNQSILLRLETFTNLPYFHCKLWDSRAQRHIRGSVGINWQIVGAEFSKDIKYETFDCIFVAEVPLIALKIIYWVNWLLQRTLLSSANKRTAIELTISGEPHTHSLDLIVLTLATTRNLQREINLSAAATLSSSKGTRFETTWFHSKFEIYCGRSSFTWQVKAPVTFTWLIQTPAFAHFENGGWRRGKSGHLRNSYSDSGQMRCESHMSIQFDRRTVTNEGGRPMKESKSSPCFRFLRGPHNSIGSPHV